MAQATVVETFSTPHSNPVKFHVRPDTSDWNTVNAITATGDEYHIPTGLTGWGLDVGAHIGACITTLLVDNPGMRAVAIEALPENVEMLWANLRLNRVQDRAIVLPGAAGSGVAPVRIGYGTDGHHDYIGSASSPGEREIVAPVVTLGDVLLAIAENAAGRDEDGPDDIAWAKIDCEGCEYPFFASDLVGFLRHIEGEVHFGSEKLHDLLKDSHDVTFPGDNPDFGPFVAVRRP